MPQEIFDKLIDIPVVVKNFFSREYRDMVVLKTHVKLLMSSKLL